jgi:membrane protease YdiL (CAAX protease family)
MYAVASQLSWNLLASAVMFAVSACVAVWAWIAARLWQRQAIVPYQPRRPVPWRAIDLAVAAACYVVLQSGIIASAVVFLGPEATRAPAIYDATGAKTEHVVAQLMSEGNVWALLLCVVSAAIVAPISEEFFFRVLLQGGLEAWQHRWRRQMPTLRRLFPGGLGPIMFTSLLFARLHFRVAAPQFNVRFLMFLLAGDAVARVLALAFAVGWMRWRVGATAADLGWAPGNLLGDVKLGLAAFAAVAAPVYAAQAGLRCVLPECIAPDPLPLFFLALVLGTLYYRTHRIVPSVVLHVALNGTSLMLAWLGS